MRVLLLEDDELLGDGLAEYLRGEGHNLTWCRSVAEAVACEDQGHEVLLVDWQLPDGSGVDWVRRRRRMGDGAAVLLITARDRLTERIQGLDAGADDYLVKPFAPEELAARLRAFARRGPMLGLRLQRGPLLLDVAARVAALEGRPIELTAREWQLVETLVRREGRVVPKAELERLVLGDGKGDEAPASNALEVHVSSLRRKLGRSFIETLRGVGYRLAPAAPTEG